jgi:flagellar basal-body rod modification protein FlgD
MPITATSSLELSAAASLSKGPSGADSEGRFLKLLVTQLKNQDPLNPLGNAELTSQLAQMSTVSGIEKLNEAFQALLGQSSASQVLQAAALIGRAVLAPGSELAGGDDKPAAFAVELPSSAESVIVTVTDADGNAVRTFDLGALPQGLHSAIWGGDNDAGEPMPAGVYRIQVTARNGASPVPATSLVYSHVESVTQGAAGVVLDLDSGESISLSDVRMVL